MQLYVLDKEFNLLGTIDNYECLVWERNYYKPGTFSMQLIPTFEQFDILKKGNILLKTDNSKEAMYINHRELEQNEDGVEVLIVSGCSITNFLSQRIITYKQIGKGNVETVMRNYVSRNCISTETSRIIPGLSQTVNNNLGQQIDMSSHYKPLIEELESIASTYELGYKIDMDLQNKKYLFDVYNGIDRTVEQNTNTKAIFSTEFDNIHTQKYADSEADYKNTVLVAGVGEDLERKTLVLGNDNVGFDRYELFVDARDISNTITEEEENGDLDGGFIPPRPRPGGSDDNEEGIKPKDDTTETTETTMTDEDYNKLLQARGEEKLAEYSRVETFDCVIANSNNLVYRQDFDLGDKVSILNKKWGLILNERIVSITETYDIDGMNIDIEIGNNVPTLIEKIKQKVRG